MPLFTAAMILAARSGPATSTGGTTGTGTGLGPGTTTPTAAAKLAAMLPADTTAGHLGVALQLLPVFVLLGGGFIAAWVCGREFTDRTIGGLFALPVARGTIAAAKLLLATALALVMTVAAWALTIVVVGAMDGFIFGPDARHTTWRLLVCGVMTVTMTPLIGLITSLTRSYLAGVGALIGVIAITEIVVTLGGGGWLPTAVPSLWAGVAGDAFGAVPAWRLLLAPGLGLATGAATSWWWQRMRLG